jgi:hypothetical protein
VQQHVRIEIDARWRTANASERPAPAEFTILKASHSIGKQPQESRPPVRNADLMLMA